MDNAINAEEKRNREENGHFLPGHNLISPGRPKGKTLKEFAREMLMSMPDDQKTEYLKTLPKDIVWKMAEGNPHNTEDLTSGGEKISPIPIFAGQSVKSEDVPEHNSDKKDIPAKE